MLLRILVLLTFLVSLSVSAHHTPQHPEFSAVRDYTHPLLVKVPPRTPLPGFGYVLVASGSVVVITPEYAITVAHLTTNKTIDSRRPQQLPPTTIRVVLIDDVEKPVKIIKVDEENDLALIKGEFRCPCASLAQRPPMQDEKAYIVGYPAYNTSNQLVPGGIQFLTEGLIQSKPDTSLVVATGNTSGGGSGGGLFVKEDGQYRLAGIISMIATVPIQNKTYQELGWITYSVPVAKVRQLIKGIVIE